MSSAEPSGPTGNSWAESANSWPSAAAVAGSAAVADAAADVGQQCCRQRNADASG